MTSGNKPLAENQCQPRSLSPCGFTTPQGINSAVPMKHSYCFKQESCFRFVNPGTAMITTVSGGLLMASRYIIRTRHCVIKTNRGWKNHGLLHCNHQVLISYPCYATIKSYMIGHTSLTGFCLSKFTPYFRWYFFMEIWVLYLDGLVLSRWHNISWTNDYPVHWSPSLCL